MKIKWKSKAFIQRFLSNVPRSNDIYFLGQVTVGRARDYRIIPKVQQGIDLLSCLYEIGEDIQDRFAVELGTGKSPVIPILFYIYGLQKCCTYDVSRWLRESLLVSAIKQLL